MARSGKRSGLSSVLLCVQGGQIARVGAHLLGLSITAHDLSRTRLWQPGHKVESGLGSDRPEFVADVVDQLGLQSVARCLTCPELNEALDAFALQRIGN